MLNDLPIIKWKSYTISFVNKDDYMDFYFMASNLNTVKYLSFDCVNSINGAKMIFDTFYLKSQDNHLPPSFAIRNKKGDMIGIINFHTYFLNSNCAEVGFILNETSQNKGIMTWALKEIVKLGFELYGYDKIIASCVDLNERSKKLILSCGFSYESVNYNSFITHGTKEKRNIIIYSMYKREYDYKKNN